MGRLPKSLYTSRIRYIAAPPIVGLYIVEVIIETPSYTIWNVHNINDTLNKIFPSAIRWKVILVPFLLTGITGSKRTFH